MKENKNILVTGGAGFIGSNLIKYALKNFKNYNIVNIDSLTYAGNLYNLSEINQSNYIFRKVDINNINEIKSIFNEFNFDIVIHLAAESHVDRSIENPFLFAHTNIIGTLNLLEISRLKWKNNFDNKVFFHVSTDEVFGSLGNSGYFNEKTKYDPRSPYSASKASSDHFVRAYGETYSLPFYISNCSNNYGPYQFPEKLIPLIINNIYNELPLPVYGKGDNVRDWLYVEDHASAIFEIISNGKIGNTYCIGGENEVKNIDIVKILIDKVDKYLDRKKGSSNKLISYVKDRKGHDFRYAIDNSKLINELGWKPRYDFNTGIDYTIKWYLDNIEWMNNIFNKTYINYNNSQTK